MDPASSIFDFELEPEDDLTFLFVDIASLIFLGETIIWVVRVEEALLDCMPGFIAKFTFPFQPAEYLRILGVQLSSDLEVPTRSLSVVGFSCNAIVDQLLLVTCSSATSSPIRWVVARQVGSGNLWVRDSVTPSSG